MDLCFKIPPLGVTKDYIVAFGHQKLLKDGTLNDKGIKEIKEAKKSVTSKLPRNVRSNSTSRTIKNKDQANVSGAAGTSRQICSSLKGRIDTTGEEDRSKPSLIPRRRTAREIPTKEPPCLRSINKNVSSRQKPLIEPKNIQRVQLLNVNPDFYPEGHSPPKSVTSARPIPTLGQIYRQDLSNDTFTDWYLESVNEYLDAPEDFVESNATIHTPLYAENIGITNSHEDNSVNEDNSKSKDNTKSTKMLGINNPLKMCKATDENVSEWISSELDHPTKDDESGYLSLSPPSKSDLGPKANNCNILRMPHGEEYYIFNNTIKKSISTTAITIGSNSDNILDEQATLIINQGNKESLKTEHRFKIPKVNTDVKPLAIPRADIHIPWKYPSTPSPSQKREDINIPAASYVEYPSEVFQRTTNFESEASATLSNIVRMNPYICENISSHCTLERMDEYSLATDNDTQWSRLLSSLESTLVKSSNTSYFTEESWRENDYDDRHGANRGRCTEKYSYHDYYNHYCWRKEVAKKNIAEQSLWDYKGRCKKCQKYRQVSKRKSITQRPLQSLKSRTWTARNCKYGWSRVWKKTAERWANWSKLPYRFGKLRLTNLQKTMVWVNANVQTTILVYRETGTDAVVREQKSAEITASLKLDSLSTFYKKATILVGKSTSISKPPSRTCGGSLRNSCESHVRRAKNSNEPFSTTKCKTHGGPPANINKSTSLIEMPIHVLDNSTVTEENTTPFEDKPTSTIIHLRSIKLSDTVSQDAYTQMLVICNNAATDINFNHAIMNDSAIITKSNDEYLYYGINKGTESIPPAAKSQRSISVMISKGAMQEIKHKEIQVSPESSITKKSTAILAHELYRDAKSNIVTDTVIPCRRLDKTLVTYKGTILSCTGTKVTSLSSVHIQPGPAMSNINAVNTGTDGLQSLKSEKSTFCGALKTCTDTGVSATNVVNQASFNGGSHHAQSSFCTVIHPECSSICINTDAYLKSKSTEVGTSITIFNDSQYGNGIKNGKDCHAQYSNPESNKGYVPSENSQLLAKIGRSQLMSVRMLGNSVAEVATQARPFYNSADTNTPFEQKVSASVLTSSYALAEYLRRSGIKLQPKEADRVLTCHCAHVSSDSEAIDLNGHQSEASSSPVRSFIPCKTNEELKSFSRLMTRNGSEPKQAASNLEPNFVISSNLNATKWIKGCSKESEKDVQSIINLSETMVTESLDRASLVIASSKDKKSINEMKKLSKVLINHQPAISCVTAKAYNTSSSVNIAKVLPATDDSWAHVEQLSSKQCDTNILLTDNIRSDETITKDIKESVHQVHPIIRDAGADFLVTTRKQKSASILTSRHILPGSNKRCPRFCENSSTDCLFVYDRPKCVIHSYRSDAVAQTESRYRNPVYKALYETTKLIAKEDATTDASSNKTENEDAIGSTSVPNKHKSQMTSCPLFPPVPCCCPRCLEAENMRNRSIQAVEGFLEQCPQDSVKFSELSREADQDSAEDFVKSYLASSCRYYSNLLTIKLGQVKENLKKHLAPPIDEIMYHPRIIPVVFTEACTMKPSGRQDQNCQAKLFPHKLNKPSCILTPAMSLTDVRGNDKQDLKNVYYILTAIEGRVRRLNNNLHT